MPDKRPALGKGLGALIPEAPAPAAAAPARGGGALQVDIDRLAPNQEQPRTHIHEGRLDDLARSIGANGILQPILVRRAGDGYRIIAGERRWRAAQRAGLRTVPVVEREVPEGADQSLLELALIENIQRENLNPVEEARGYDRLATEFGLSHEQIAAAVGKDRSTVANFVRLLHLPDEVLGNVSAGELSMGHARALLGLPDAVAQRQAAREVVARGLSVRDTEALVKKASKAAGSGGEQGSGTAKSREPDVHTRAAEDKIRFALGAKVRIVRRGHGGAIEITFNTEAELNRLYEALTASA
jgi:ParB family chromosome partitioning protein